MSEIMIMTIVKKALMAGIMVAGPILMVSLIVGLIISIFQATTQIQEQTLTFVPKLITIILVMVICGPWMLNKLVLFTTELFSMISTIVRYINMLLVFFRITAFFMSANVIFPSGTPKLFKIVFSLIVSTVLGVNIDIGIIENTYQLVVCGVLETVNGLVLGYIVNLCFYSLKLAGNLIDYQIGLSMSSTYDPNTNANATIMQNFIYFIGLIIFFGLNAHHVLINSILNSFEIIPIGYSILNNNFGYIMKVFIEYFIVGIKIASPIVLILILTDLITGVISRSISGLNVMIIGMPLKMLVGLIFIIAALPFIINEIQELFKGLGNVLDGGLTLNLQVIGIKI